MNYVDKTLIRLAEPATRDAVFDQEGLAHIVAAGYDTQAMPVEGPYAAVFDELRAGFYAPRLGLLEGAWQQAGRPELTEARIRLSGVGPDATARIDAFWRGAVVARTVPDASRVTAANVTWPSLGTIDAEIVATLGALPADGAALEAERRTRLLTRLRVGLDQPDALTNGAFDTWLQSTGATSATDLLTRFQGTILPGTVSVTFSLPDATPPSPVPLPVAAAIVIRDAGFSVAQLLMESKLIRSQVEPLGLDRPRDPTLRPRGSPLIVWVLPAAVFDDPDWPGGEGAPSAVAQRAARRAAAGRWLAAEGIGLVTTT